MIYNYIYIYHFNHYCSTSLEKKCHQAFMHERTRRQNKETDLCTAGVWGKKNFVQKKKELDIELLPYKLHFN